MGGKRRLRAGAPRLLGNHNGARGKAFRKMYNALAREFPLDTPLLKLEAGRAAVAWANLECSAQSRMGREEGRGAEGDSRRGGGR
jgi:hypothetical protein